MLGDVQRAEPLFVQAVSLRRQLYGKSAALAALQQNLGRLMVRSGRAAEALPLLEEALELAREFTGPRSPITLTVMLSVAEARVMSADARAAASLREAMAAIAAQLGEDHVLYARAEQVLARLQLREGRRAQAKVTIDRSERRLVALGKAGAPHLAEIQKLRKELEAR
jgi:non-specific serine/threonine protein kinase/serine/threonine-protein kinase